jgi:HEXXH motif-containing protein
MRPDGELSDPREHRLLDDPSLRFHSLSERDFDALAAGTGDADAVERLKASEYSYRLTVLRAVLDAARGTPAARGPLLDVDAAWEILASAERASPTTVMAVLRHPPVGTWAARTLRRLRGRRHDDVPLWVDLGYLHSLAAAAVARAGQTGRITVPVRQGVLILPTLGHTRTRVRAPWDTAEVLMSAGRVRLVGPFGSIDVAPGGGTDPRWFPTRSLVAEAEGTVARFVLEDADPFRLLGPPAAPARLTPADVARWRRGIEAGWRVLTADSPEQARRIAGVSSTIVPLPKAGRFQPRSASSGDSFGAVIMSEPEDPARCAATLSHEFQHAKLNPILHLFDLFTPGWTELMYAPWRDDPRPPRGLVHGIYAYCGVAAFWRRHRTRAHAGEAMLAHFEFALWRSEVWSSLLGLRGRPELTDLGRRFLDGLVPAVEAWLAEPVPAVAGVLARMFAADHRALWRAFHLRPRPDLIDRLSDEFIAGRPASRVPPPPESPGAVGGWNAIAADASVRGLDARANLARLWLADRDEFRATARGGAPEQIIAGGTPADCAFIAGHVRGARDLYLSRVAASPDDARAWVGLGLTLGPTPAGRALLGTPEIVLAVARAATRRVGRSPDPLALASWLGSGMGAGGAHP